MHLLHPILRPLPVAGIALPIALLLFAISMGTGSLRAETGSTIHSLAHVTSGSQETVDHSAFDNLLRAYVVAGSDGINRVDFKRFKKDGHEALKAYITALQQIDPTRLDGPEHFAYFANLYNALTLDIVLDAYPVASINDVRVTDAAGNTANAPWKVKLARVNGVALSLDDISGKVLRPAFMSRDPRGHYMLNCLSVGCPKLFAEAITGDKLEVLLTEAAEAFVTHPRGLSVAEGKAKSSSLYAWYEADFGGPQGVIAHMAEAGGPEIAEQLKGIELISSHHYDWSLVDAK